MDGPADTRVNIWRDGPRWTVALSVLYPDPHGGQAGPFFRIGHAWRKSTAQRLASEAEHRLARARAATGHATTQTQ